MFGDDARLYRQMLVKFQDFGQRVLGRRWAWIMSAAVAISTFGAANGTAFTGGRCVQREDYYNSFITRQSQDLV
jgi:hypothetical protein